MKSDLLTVVGFDPSLRNWGMAKGTYNIKTNEVDIHHVDITQPVLSKSKQVRQNSLDIESASQLYSKALDYIKTADVVFIEVPVGSQNARAMASYGICIGVIAALDSDTQMIQLTPTEVKLASFGKATATKSEMISWAVGKHPSINWPTHNGKINNSSAEHMADAVASIYAGVSNNQFLQLLNLYRKNHAN